MDNAQQCLKRMNMERMLQMVLLQEMFSDDIMFSLQKNETLYPNISNTISKPKE